MRIRVVALSLLLLAGAVAAGPVIVQEGQPRAVIVTADTPTDSAKRAAAELQLFLERISGARLPILAESADRPAGHVALFVGRSRAADDRDIPSGDDCDRTREGFVLRTTRRGVILAGNEGANYHGTEYAVYELLERLGCRWFFPGPFGEIVPKQATIELPDLDLVRTPSFTVRNIWTSGWADAAEGFDTWLLRNKGTGKNAFAFPGDGTIHALVPPAVYAKDNPEMYAMRPDGRRTDASTPAHEVMLCTTSRKAVEVAASNIVAWFRLHPEANSYGFSAPDGSPRCYCPPCTAACHAFLLDSGIGECISDPYFNFVNNIARQVLRDAPDKLLVVLAYANRVRPPEGLDQPWSPNILVQIAQLRCSAIRPIGDEKDYFAQRRMRVLQAWARLCPKLLIYDYDPHADLSRMPFWRGRALAEEMRTYRRHGVLGFTTEGQPTFFRTGLNYYLRARLMWDENADVDAWIEDFHQHFYGAAADPMKQFFSAVEQMLASTPDHMAWTPLAFDWSSVYPPDKVAALEALLDRAESLADTAEVRQRVRMVRLLHDYMTSHLRAFELYHAGRFAEARRAVSALEAPITAAQSIQKGLLPPDPGWVLSDQQGLRSMEQFLDTTADRADGRLGRLLGLAPATAQFLPDPRNTGLFEQWQRDDVAETLKWNDIALARDWGLNGYRDEQGYAYDGIGWYRFRTKVEKPPRDGTVQLLVPELYAEKAWIWVNGELVFSPTTPPAAENAVPPPGTAVVLNRRGRLTVFVNVQKPLRPGRDNSVTLRLLGTLDRAQHRGLVGRPLFWAPTTPPAAAP